MVYFVVVLLLLIETKKVISIFGREKPSKKNTKKKKAFPHGGLVSNSKLTVDSLFESLSYLRIALRYSTNSYILRYFENFYSNPLEAFSSLLLLELY